MLRRFRFVVFAFLLLVAKSNSSHATYSIVARDADTGQLGVAVQSHWFSVGSIVAWAEAGVGAVATQSLVDVTYGPLGLDMMRAGRSAEQTLRGLLLADNAPEIRQVAMIDGQGNVSVHTGDGCIPEAGHASGENYSVQANLMANDTVPAAMARAFENTRGTLAVRMLAALVAAEGEGGDIRGMQSAAIIVVEGESTGRAWADTVVDLRVDDHTDPVTELQRLYRVHQGYDAMNRGDLAMEHGDIDAAKAAYGEAEAILGDNLEAKFWHAVALANAGELEVAIPMFHAIFERGENWRVLTPRLAGTFLQVDEKALARILGP